MLPVFSRNWREKNGGFPCQEKAESLEIQSKSDAPGFTAVAAFSADPEERGDRSRPVFPEHEWNRKTAGVRFRIASRRCL